MYNEISIRYVFQTPSGRSQFLLHMDDTKTDCAQSSNNVILLTFN